MTDQLPDELSRSIDVLGKAISNVLRIQSENVQSQAASTMLAVLRSPDVVLASAETMLALVATRPDLLQRLAHDVAVRLADIEAQAVQAARPAETP